MAQTLTELKIQDIARGCKLAPGSRIVQTNYIDLVAFFGFSKNYNYTKSEHDIAIFRITKLKK